MITRDCVWCGRKFKAKQERAKYCSRKCNMAYFRASERKQAQKDIAHAKGNDDFEEEEFIPEPKLINGRPRPTTDLGWNSLARETIDKLSRRSDVAPPGAKPVKSVSHRGI